MSRTLHQLNSRITGMICPRCQKRYPVGDYFFGCPACLERGASSNLTLVYEGKAQIQKDATGWHRYRDFLPYDDTVSLGEGFTPVRTFPRLAKELGFRKLYTKHEFQNPTGSHKDRMNPFITARAREVGYSTVTCASSGNEAASLAAYAAVEGLNCVNVSTRSIPSLWKNASDATGAELVLTDTPAARLFYQKEQLAQGKDWYPATNLLDIPSGSSPYGIDGYKTLSFELYEQLEGQLPDYLLIPTCRGDLLYGVYLGFRALLETGYIKTLPRLVACEPIPRLELILSGQKRVEDKFEGDTSSMSSIGGNTATWQSVTALRESGGFALSASDTDIRDAVRAMASHGLYLETSSAVVYPCAKKAQKQGLISSHASVLFVLTSNGYKNTNLA